MTNNIKHYTISYDKHSHASSETIRKHLIMFLLLKNCINLSSTTESTIDFSSFYPLEHLEIWATHYFSKHITFKINEVETDKNSKPISITHFNPTDIDNELNKNFQKKVKEIKEQDFRDLELDLTIFSMG